MGFVHKDELPFLVRREAATGLSELIWLDQVPRTLLRIGQIETERILGHLAVEQRGFARLPRPEQEVDVATLNLACNSLAYHRSNRRLEYNAHFQTALYLYRFRSVRHLTSIGRHSA